MNETQSPKLIAFLRHALALALAVYLADFIGWAFSPGLSKLSILYLPVAMLFFLLPIVMIAPKWEVWYGILMATIIWGVISLGQYHHDREGYVDQISGHQISGHLARNAGLWVLTMLVSLAAALPVRQWRQWRRRQGAGNQVATP